MDAEFITKYVVPPILGGIAGFFSPWVKYRFETLKGRRDDRRALIDRWKRELLDSSLYFDFSNEQKKIGGHGLVDADTGIVTPEESYSRLIRSPSYASLKPYLSPPALEKLKRYSGRQQITLVLGPAENVIRDIVASEIHRIEKSWKLI